MILKILMRLGLVHSVDEYLLKNNGRNLAKLRKKINDFDNFLKWYLNQEYDSDPKYNQAVFHYLNARNLVNLDKDIIEEMAIESRYLESIPEEEIMMFLSNFNYDKFNALTSMKVLGTYLTSRISNSFDLISLMDKRAPIDYDYAYRKLLTGSVIGKLEEYYYSVKRSMDIRINLGIKAAQSGLYSVEELKNFFLDVNMPSVVVIESFIGLYKNADLVQKEKIIEEFIAIMNANQNDVDEIHNGNLIEGYDFYLSNIKGNSNISMKMKNDIARKILEDKNYDFIYAWFRSNIMCDYNFNLIDALMLEDECVARNVLTFINLRYLEYAVSKLLNRDKDFIIRVMNIMCSSVYSIDQYRVDQILDMIFNRYYDFKLSRRSILNLIMARSKYLPRFMCKLQFSVGERQTLLDCHWMNEDFRTIYEKYLRTGDRKYLPSEREAKREFEELQNSRQRLRNRRFKI